MLLLKTCIGNRDHRTFILLYLIIQSKVNIILIITNNNLLYTVCIVKTRPFDSTNSARILPSESRKNKSTCDEARSQCDRLYSVLSTVEEDCKTYRIYLGCLSMLKVTQTLCQADFHYWMMLSTTEKLITEKCSPGDTSPIEPPREIFNYPIASKPTKTNKISSLSPCLDTVHGSSQSKSQYHSCALFGHPNIINYSGERQTCRLQGAWPLVNNRYISVQVSGKKYNQFHFHDSTASAITQVSIILKPDGKCLGDLAVPTLIYVASSNFRLSNLFLNSRRDMHQSMISIKSVDITDFHEKVELWFGYINTRIYISRTLVAEGEHSLSVSVLLPSQVATAKPRSKQQSLVRELCSLGCSTAESIDEPTLFSHLSAKLKQPHPQINPSEFCRVKGLSGAFFDVCYLMSKLVIFTNNLTPQSPTTKKSIESYISISVKHAQKNIIDFSKSISENFSVDLSQRMTFQPYRPLWKIRDLEAQYRRRSKRSSIISPACVTLTSYLSLLVLTLVSRL